VVCRSSDSRPAPRQAGIERIAHQTECPSAPKGASGSPPWWGGGSSLILSFGGTSTRHPRRLPARPGSPDPATLTSVHPAGVVMWTPRCTSGAAGKNSPVSRSASPFPRADGGSWCPAHHHTRSPTSFAINSSTSASASRSLSSSANSGPILNPSLARRAHTVTRPASPPPLATHAQRDGLGLCDPRRKNASRGPGIATPSVNATTSAN